jgi:hypothetical protein
MSFGVKLQRKARTGKEMAKDALKSSARQVVREAAWPESGTCVITLGEYSQTFELLPTAGIKDGRIMYHAGGRDSVEDVNLTIGTNVMLDRAVPNFAEIAKKYNLEAGKGEPTDAELSEGEQV